MKLLSNTFFPVFFWSTCGIMHNSFCEFFTNNGNLHQNQLGFQINNSNEHVILQFTCNVTQTVNKAKSTIWCLNWPFQNFNAIDHQILRKKVKHFRVHEKAILGSEVIFSKESNKLKIIMTSSIYLNLIIVSHRGSKLEPLLFLVYVNVTSTFHLNLKTSWLLMIQICLFQIKI